MLLLIEVDNDEQYEDYRSWVEYVFDVETDKTNHQLSAEYKCFISDKLLNEHNIVVDPYYTYLVIKETKVLKKEIKIVEKIHIEFSFVNWLKQNYKCKELDFQTYHQ